MDLRGLASYEVARPVGSHSGVPGLVADHTFLAHHADYPGDPNATIESWGDVNGTIGTDPAVRDADVKAWKRLAGDMCPVDPQTSGENFRLLPAADEAVADWASRIAPGQPYSAASGTNSNSVTSAVANEASQQSLAPMPRAWGAERAGSVRFR
jgi:hypothetical protein